MILFRKPVDGSATEVVGLALFIILASDSGPLLVTMVSEYKVGDILSYYKQYNQYPSKIVLMKKAVAVYLDKRLHLCRATTHLFCARHPILAFGRAHLSFGTLRLQYQLLDLSS